MAGIGTRVSSGGGSLTIPEPLRITDIKNKEEYWQIIGGPSGASWTSMSLFSPDTKPYDDIFTLKTSDGNLVTVWEVGGVVYYTRHNTSGNILATSSITISGLLQLRVAINSLNQVCIAGYNPTKINYSCFDPTTGNWSNIVSDNVVSSLYTRSSICAGPSNSFLSTHASSASANSVTVLQVEYTGSDVIAITDTTTLAVATTSGESISYSPTHGIFVFTSGGAYTYTAYNATSVSGVWSASSISGSIVPPDPGVAYLFLSQAISDDIYCVFYSRAGSGTYTMWYFTVIGGVVSPPSLIYSNVSTQYINRLMVEEAGKVRVWSITSSSTSNWMYERDILGTWTKTGYTAFNYKGTGGGVRISGVDYLFFVDDTSSVYYQYAQEATPGMNTGYSDVAIRLNSNNKAGTNVLMIDPGGYGNNDTEAGELWIGNPTGNNDTMKVYGDAEVTGELTMDSLVVTTDLKVSTGASGYSGAFRDQSGALVTVVNGVVVSVV